MRPKARIDLVEQTIRARGWDEKIVADLLKATGRDRATLYRDRAVILKKLAAEESAGLEERRAAFLLDLRRVQQEARAARQFSPATRLLAMESQVLGLDRVPLPTVNEDDVAAPVDTSLEGLLREVRRMRLASQAGHVYTAAEKLLEREHAILNDIRARDAARAAAEHAHLDEAGLVELVEQAAAGLPDAVKARLRSALGGA